MNVEEALEVVKGAVPPGRTARVAHERRKRRCGRLNTAVRLILGKPLSNDYSAAPIPSAGLSASHGPTPALYCLLFTIIIPGPRRLVSASSPAKPCAVPTRASPVPLAPLRRGSLRFLPASQFPRRYVHLLLTLPQVVPDRGSNR